LEHNQGDDENQSSNNESNNNEDEENNLYKKQYLPLRNRRKRVISNEFVSSDVRTEPQEKRRKRERRSSADQAIRLRDRMSDDSDSNNNSDYEERNDDKLKQLFKVAIDFEMDKPDFADGHELNSVHPLHLPHPLTYTATDQEQLEVLKQMRKQVDSLTNEAKMKDMIIFDLMNKIQQSDQQMASLSQALWSSREVMQNYYALQKYFVR
jgi:hypothetical protein